MALTPPGSGSIRHGYRVAGAGNKWFGAAAAGLLAGSASAQSSVQIYGMLDVSIARSNGGSSLVQNLHNTRSWREDGLTSRLGFRGIEDLGDGYRASFVLEHRLKPDTGASAVNTFWEGKSVVALGGPFGEVYLGRDYVPAFYPAVKGDPFGYDQTIGSIIGLQFAGYLVDGGSRASNAVGYKTPKLGGFTAQLAVAAGEGARRRETGVNVEYTAGPAYVGIGADRQDANNRVAIVTAAYDFGVVRPTFSYTRSKYGAAGVQGRHVLVGATAPVPGGAAKLAYSRLDPDTGRGSLTGAATGSGAAARWKLGLGYEYRFSKRSSIFTDLAAGRQELASRSRTTGVEAGIHHRF